MSASSLHNPVEIDSRSKIRSPEIQPRLQRSEVRKEF